MGRTKRTKEGYFCLMKRSNGIFYYWVYDNFGRRIYRSTGEKTRTRAMDVALQRYKTGTLIEEARPVCHVFGNYAADFWNWETCPVIQDKIRRGGHYSAMNARSNAKMTDKHIIPYFKKALIEAITPRQVEDWILRLPVEHRLSNKSCNNILTIFRQILDAAVADGIIERNPAKVVKPLIKDGKRKGCFTIQQIRQLFSKEWDHRYAYIACYLASRTGMRMGEVQALTRGQIHDGYIEVNASWADLEGRKSTKSGWGRIVPVDPQTMNLLREVMPPGEDDLLFTLSGTRPMCNNAINVALKAAMDAAGIDHKTERLTFHSFRHFFNTRLKAAEVDGEKVRAVLGHESIEMTEHYLHLTAEDLESIRAVQRGLAL